MRSFKAVSTFTHWSSVSEGQTWWGSVWILLSGLKIILALSTFTCKALHTKVSVTIVEKCIPIRTKEISSGQSWSPHLRIFLKGNFCVKGLELAWFSQVCSSFSEPGVRLRTFYLQSFWKWKRSNSYHTLANSKVLTLSFLKIEKLEFAWGTRGMFVLDTFS